MKEVTVFSFQFSVVSFQFSVGGDLVEDRRNALFAPEGAVLADPAEIERALTAMWEAAESDGSKAVATRVCTANLIVVADVAEQHDIFNVLGELSPVYPTRTIVVLLDEDARDASGGDLWVSVSAVCHVPQPDRPQICCEQVVLRGPLSDDADLDRTLLTMLEADLPRMFWWALDPGRRPVLLARLTSLADRFILDAGLAGFKVLTPAQEQKAMTGTISLPLATRSYDWRCPVRELGWYRTGRVRELLAQLFDEVPTDCLSRIDRLGVRVAGGSVEHQVDAIWLVAFIGGQLGWRPVSALGPGKYEFASKHLTVQVDIEFLAAGMGLVDLTITATNHTFSLSRYRPAADEYRIEIGDENVCRMPRSVQLRPLAHGDALASAMAGRPVDAAFNRAASLAAWMAQVENSKQ
ncbi:MAG: hypothetical protein GXY44_00170 [Phycisphaerales bacterium]|nr:hypothetical protein [Phycisphaerales bacterium]